MSALFTSQTEILLTDITPLFLLCPPPFQKLALIPSLGTKAPTLVYPLDRVIHRHWPSDWEYLLSKGYTRLGASHAQRQKQSWLPKIMHHQKFEDGQRPKKNLSVCHISSSQPHTAEILLAWDFSERWTTATHTTMIAPHQPTYHNIT